MVNDPYCALSCGAQYPFVLWFQNIVSSYCAKLSEVASFLVKGRSTEFKVNRSQCPHTLIERGTKNVAIWFDCLLSSTESLM